jgi:DNA modification methylase
MNDWLDRCHFGDCLDVLRRMPDGIVNTCVTSPPYFGLRDYGHVGQIGLEATPDEFVGKLVEVFREVRRVLREDGTLWLNLGDTYATGAGKAASPGGGAQGERFLESGPSGYRGGHTDSPKHKMPQTADAKNANANIPKFQPNRMPLPGLKPKDLIGIPWMAAFALRADGWYLRQDIIWAKPNPMPESVTDRCTKSHEYIFLLSKSAAYRCDMDAIAEKSAYPGDNRAERSDTRKSVDPMCMDGGSRARTGNPTGETRNKRSVWTVSTKPYAGAHFATFPPDLIEPCILAGAPAGGVVLDPFFGSGTTGQVAQALGRRYIGIELNEAYKPLQDERLCQPSLDLEAA